MTPLSAQLNDLSVRTKKTEDLIAATREKDRNKLEAHRAELEATIQAGNERVVEAVDGAKDAASTWWDETRASVDSRFATLRAKAETHRAERDAKRAERQADDAEADAADAVAWAIYVLDQAEYAVADAVIARLDADQLAVNA
jgi:chromosome segregation ATPase